MGISLEHQWTTQYSIDEGVTIDCTLRLELYFVDARSKYVLCAKGADFTTGRHWNKEGPPDQEFDDVKDALDAYRQAASRYAPTSLYGTVCRDIDEILAALPANGDLNSRTPRQ